MIAWVFIVKVGLCYRSKTHRSLNEAQRRLRMGLTKSSSEDGRPAVFFFLDFYLQQRFTFFIHST